MPVNWNLALGGGSNSIGDAYQEGRALADQEADRQRKIAAQDRALRDQQAYRGALSEALATGDYTKAAANAALYGMDKEAETFRDLQKNTSDQRLKGAEGLANFHRALKATPYEQRSGVIQANRPFLLSMGAVAEAFDGFDPTDENIDATAQAFYSHNDYDKNRIDQFKANTDQQKADWDERKPISLAPGATAFDPVTGAPIFTSPQIVTTGQGAVSNEVGGVGYGREVSMNDASQRMAAEFKRLGVPDAVTAGFLGNAHHESGFDPSKPGDSGTAHGYFQHRLDRVDNFQRVTGAHPSRATPEQAAQFAVWELKNPKAAGMTPEQVSAIYAENDPARAAMLIQEYYERPKVLDQRRAATAVGYSRKITPTASRPVREIASVPPKASSGNANGLSKTQVGAARTKMTDLNAIAAQLDRVEVNMESAESGGWTGWIGGRVPAGLDAESDVFDKSIRLLASQIRKLTRTPGEGAMSDYESRLAEMTLPGRTDTAEGRREAIAGLRELVRLTREGYAELVGSGAATDSVVTVRTRAEAMRLPSGTKFRAPDGQVRVRP